MEWNFKLREKLVSFTIAEEVIAVRPTKELRKSASRSQLIDQFGRPLEYHREASRHNSDIALQNRAIFERAGWIFVDASAELVKAADTRTPVPGAQAVAPVLISSTGELMLGTDLVTIQLPRKLSEDEALKLLQQDSLAAIRVLRFAPNTFEVRLPPGPSLPKIIGSLQERSDRYHFAEPTILQIMSGRMKPSDPDYDQQWQHSNDGSNGGTVGADIHAEPAWDITRGQIGERAIRLAVIDNGMDIDHPDLKPGIVGGGHFYADGIGGATFIRLQGSPRFPRGRLSHGTFCMGMAGARMNNTFGGCGSAPEAGLLAIACLRDQVGSQATLARAVAYAADPTREDTQAAAADGADVISCSLGPATDWDMHSVLDLAIRFAATTGRNGLGVPVFWAVSNYSVEVSRDEVCSHPDVIAVGRSNRTDSQDGSAFGPKLEFLAPGRDVYSTLNGGRHGLGSGSSYATPLCAGVGALVLSCHPGWTAQEVRQQLIRTCDKVGGVVYDPSGHSDQYGFGRLNAEQAVQ